MMMMMVMSECLHPFLSVLNIIMLAACKGRGGGSGVLCVCGHVNTPSSLVSSMLHRLSIVFTLTIIIFTLSVYHLVWWSCMGGCSLECCSRSGTHGMIVRALLSLCVASRGSPSVAPAPRKVTGRVWQLHCTESGMDVWMAELANARVVQKVWLSGCGSLSRVRESLPALREA